MLFPTWDALIDAESGRTLNEILRQMGSDEMLSLMYVVHDLHISFIYLHDRVVTMKVEHNAERRGWESFASSLMFLMSPMSLGVLQLACLGEMVVLKYEATSQNRTEACYQIKFEGLQVASLLSCSILLTSQDRVPYEHRSRFEDGCEKSAASPCWWSKAHGGSDWVILKVKVVVEAVDLASLKWISSHHWATFFATIYIYVHVYILYIYIFDIQKIRIAVVGEIVKSLALDEDSHHGIFLWTRKCQAWLDSCSLSDCQSLSRHRLMGVVLIICLFEMGTATSLARQSYVSLVHIFRLPIHKWHLGDQYRLEGPHHGSDPR